MTPAWKAQELHFESRLLILPLEVLMVDEGVRGLGVQWVRHRGSGHWQQRWAWGRRRITSSWVACR
eukprot:7052587-Alexandrium_andersonii.AAC.1